MQTAQMAAIVFVIVEAFKRLVKVESRYIPAVSLGVGVTVGFFANDWIGGLLAGAAASGIYDFGKKSLLDK